MVDKQRLRQLQRIEVDILDEIDRISRINNIRYCLVGGTLLGAVRHQGFIPWDDDLDVAMPRSDYEKFINVCKSQISADYYIHSVDSDPTYWLPFIKVRKKYTIFEEKNTAGLGCQTGIYVDIFPLDDAKDADSIPKRVITKLIKEISTLYLYKIGFYKKHDCRVMRRVLYSILSVIPTRTLQKQQTRLMKHYNCKSADYYVNYGSNYDPIKQTMPKKVYEPFTEVLFEGKSYYAPNDTDYFLRRLYGNNYMELPPEEKRITHDPVNLVFDTRENVEKDNR